MLKNPVDFSQIKAVLYDFDGTLLDSNELIAESWRHTVKSLAGREISDDEIRSSLGEMLADSMRRLVPEADPDTARDFYREYQREIFLDRISLFDGTKETLNALKEAGYKNALATSRLKTSTFRALDWFGITDCFDTILTANDTDKFKPDPTPIFMVLDTLGCRPEEAIFIGDTVHDIEAGAAAGVFTLLVDWSFALPPGPVRDNAPAPDGVLKRMQDIPELLGVKK